MRGRILPLLAAASAARSSVKPVVLNGPTVRPASLGAYRDARVLVHNPTGLAVWLCEQLGMPDTWAD
jgi:hypothetical protein